MANMTTPRDFAERASRLLAEAHTALDQATRMLGAQPSSDDEVAFAKYTMIRAFGRARTAINAAREELP